MISIVFILATFFNALYWTAKLGAEQYAFLFGIHKSFISIFGLYSLLNFLAVCSLVADTIIRWDEYETLGQQKWRMSLTVLIAFSFGSQVLLALMSLFTRGEIV
ncbi:MAG: hypothetical protein RL609_679 [Bacteroidota bacterium]|jgi:hypothetical protein